MAKEEIYRIGSHKEDDMLFLYRFSGTEKDLDDIICLLTGTGANFFIERKDKESNEWVVFYESGKK